MTEINNLMQKAITSTGLKTQGAVLTREQSDTFTDYMWDASVLMSQARTVPMNGDIIELDKMAVGQRILRGATEAVDDGVAVGARFNKISLTSTKFRADFELSTEALEDNIEGSSFEDHLVRLLSAQIGQDLEDLAINGDIDSSDPLLHHLDGWGKRGVTDGNVIDHAGANIDQALLSRLIKAMPRKYTADRNSMKFFTTPNLVQDHVDNIGLAAAAAHNFDPRAELNVQSDVSGAAGYTVRGSGGILMQELPLLESYDVDSVTAGEQTGGNVLLVNPKNLVFGVRRGMEVYSEFKPKKDTTEWTIFTRVAANVEEHDAFVTATNVSEKV